MELILNNVRGSFLKIWEPEQFNGTGKARCSMSAIIDAETGKAELQKVVAAIQKVSADKWGAKAGDVLKTLRAKGDLCLHSGDEKAEFAGFAGNMFVSAANEARPVVCDRGRKPLTQADGKPYAGCYLNVKIDIWAQDNQYGKRVNAKLLVVQYVGEGEAFGGGAVGRAEDMPDLGEEEGAAAGAGVDLFDDDIPF